MKAGVLIIGATGVFGRRFAAHLARTDGLQIALGSRSAVRARRLGDELEARAETRAQLVPVALDVADDLAPTLGKLRPTVVVDCSGPFQARGYRTPLAAAAAGAHFVDLADARDYIRGFGPALDDVFRAKGLVALTGASSSPALAASVLADVTRGWRRVDLIDIAIVPGGRSEVGEAAVGAALSYCGKPVPVVTRGALDTVTGWGVSRRIKIAGLGSRIVSPVETADAELLHALYPAATSIRFWAGLESLPERAGMRCLAAARRRGLMRDPSALTLPLTRARRVTRLTTGTAGAMQVRVTGVDADGQWTDATWRLIARRNDGPHVPPSPAAAAVRAILAGLVPAGARPALDLPLAAIEAEFAGYAIDAARDIRRIDRTFVHDALGSVDFASLSPAVAAFHAAGAPVSWSGEAVIDAPSARPARMVARLFGFPPAGRCVPVSVQIDRKAAPDPTRTPVETWTRCFGERCFISHLGSDDGGRTTERFGPLTFELDLHVRDGRLFYPVKGWRIGPVRLPAMLLPCSDAFEWQDATGRFIFDVRLSHPLLGLLAHYRGWLMPSAPGLAAQQTQDTMAVAQPTETG